MGEELLGYYIIGSDEEDEILVCPECVRDTDQVVTEWVLGDGTVLSDIVDICARCGKLLEHSWSCGTLLLANHNSTG